MAVGDKKTNGEYCLVAAAAVVTVSPHHHHQKNMEKKNQNQRPEYLGDKNKMENPKRIPRTKRNQL